MTYQTGILPALKDWGLTVVEVPGWKTRGSSSFDPKGHVLHHDVVPDQAGDDDNIPSIIVNGRSDLPGPLANFWLERDGNVHLCAAGRANHAGEGGWKGLDSNSEVWGTEMNNLGVPSDPWPDEQLEAAALLCRATMQFSDFDSGYVIGHKEWATPPGRKTDPHTIDMDAFRTYVRLQEKEGLSVADIEALRTTIIRQHQKDRELLNALDKRQAARDRADAKAEREAEQEIIGLLAEKD